MSIVRLVTVVLLALAGLASARDASAQIYLWRDQNGNPVVSGTPPKGTTQYSTYRVPGAATGITATRPAVEHYKSEYDAIIDRHATANGIRPDLVRAVIQVESGFDPRARSPKGAKGLMQLMPGTALDMGVLRPYDPEENIRGGVRYLRTLLNRYGNDETLALAAYNAGPEAVAKYGGTVPPYRETQDYVGKVQSISPQAAVAASAPDPNDSALVAAAKAARANGTAVRGAAPAAQGLRTIYKTTVIGPDGLPIARYTDVKPTSGDYEIYSYRR